jgi:hypothetical protein
MDIHISNTCLETMQKLGMINDYTDDGFVLHEDAGWQPAGDVIEYYLGMEDYELEKAKEKVRASVERRASQAEKTAQAFTQR